MAEPEVAVATEMRTSVILDQSIYGIHSCVIETEIAAAKPPPLLLPSAKTSTPPSSTTPRSTRKLTKDEKQDLIKYYTGLFVKSFRKWSASPLGEVAAANREARLRAKDNQYASIPAVHADYEALLQQHCEAGIQHDVYETWVKFSEVEGYLWGKCISLSTQRKRRVFIRQVVEQIKKQRFDPEAFQDEYREYYGKGFDESGNESGEDS